MPYHPSSLLIQHILIDTYTHSILKYLILWTWVSELFRRNKVWCAQKTKKKIENDEDINILKKEKGVLEKRNVVY